MSLNYVEIKNIKKKRPSCGDYVQYFIDKEMEGGSNGTVPPPQAPC